MTDDSLPENMILEVEEGGQLEIRDIQKALQLCSFNRKECITSSPLGVNPSSFQLYFGPGFENRLELEVEA